MAENLETWLRTRIHTTWTHLLDMTPRTPSQEHAHGMCMGRLAVLELGGGTDPLDTGAVCRDDIDAMEFKDFKAFILNIEHETSAVYMQSTRTQEAYNIASSALYMQSTRIQEAYNITHPAQEYPTTPRVQSRGQIGQYKSSPQGNGNRKRRSQTT